MNNRIRWFIKKIIPVYNFFFNKKKNIHSHTIQTDTVAYIIDGGIGDAIMAYPAILFLKKSLPESKLTVFVPDTLYSIISTVFNEISIKPIKSLILFTVKNIFLRRRFSISFVNTTTVFNVTIEVIAFLSGRKAFGFRYPNENKKQRLYEDSCKFNESIHFAEQNIKLVSETLHIPYNKSDIFLPLRTDRKNELSGSDIIIHPGSKKGYQNKRWPVENYTELIKQLTEKGYTITILLGPDDILQKRQFQDIGDVQILIKPSITKLLDTFKEAAFFIGNDSGPAHLAAFYSVPGITLFGPESPQRSAPCGKTSVSVYNDTDCSPCHFKQISCEDNRCMKSITVNQVWKEIENSQLAH